MKASRSAIWAVLLFGLPTGCGFDVLQQKQDYVETAEFRLSQVSIRIDELEHVHADTIQQGMSANPALVDTINQLDEKQVEAHKRLDQVKHAGVATWKGARTAMDTALEDLERSYEVAVFLLEETWQDLQEDGASSRRYLLVMNESSTVATLSPCSSLAL
jgi:hypothetical protein